MDADRRGEEDFGGYILHDVSRILDFILLALRRDSVWSGHEGHNHTGILERSLGPLCGGLTLEEGTRKQEDQ